MKVTIQRAQGGWIIAVNDLPPSLLRDSDQNKTLAIPENDEWELDDWSIQLFPPVKPNQSSMNKEKNT